MDKKELGAKLKGKISETAGTVKNTIKDAKISEKLSEVKLSEKISEVKIPDQVKNVFKKGNVADSGSGGTRMAPEAEETNAISDKQKEDLSKSEIQTVKVVSPVNAVKAFYYLMAADGEVKQEEEERFNLIGKEIDPEFDEHREYIVTSCKGQLDKIIDSDDYYDVVQDGVEEALLSEQVLDKGVVPARLLVWNLLTIAYSDDEYNDVERRLMKYIVRKTDISKDVFLEMESSYLTVQDIEKELAWIKTTDRPYLTIETQVKELERREQAILESVKALIYL